MNSGTELPFKDVLDVILKDKDVGLRVSGDTDEVPVVILDPADDFLIVEELHYDRRSVANEVCEVTGLCVGLFFDMMGMKNRLGDAITPSSMRVAAPISSAHDRLLTFYAQQKMIDSLDLGKVGHS